jgi:hypothetical protein
MSLAVAQIQLKIGAGPCLGAGACTGQTLLQDTAVGSRKLTF